MAHIKHNIDAHFVTGLSDMIYKNRCGRCVSFQGNKTRCPDDTENRKRVYANDYKCGNFKEESD